VQERDWRGGGAAGRRGDEAAASSLSLSREDGRPPDAGWIRLPARKEVPAARDGGWAAAHRWEENAEWGSSRREIGGEVAVRGGGETRRRRRPCPVKAAAAPLSGEGGGAELGGRRIDGSRMRSGSDNGE
jgi:hypothetical protein